MPNPKIGCQWSFIIFTFKKYKIQRRKANDLSQYLLLKSTKSKEGKPMIFHDIYFYKVPNPKIGCQWSFIIFIFKKYRVKRGKANYLSQYLFLKSAKSKDQVPMIFHNIYF